MASNKLNLDYLKARKLALPALDHIHLALIGGGGTGSWLAPAVARYARLLIELGKDVKVTFIDPDKVESKNIYRQNFCDAEIGLFKAETLANRFGLAWGIPITAMNAPFTATTSLQSGGYTETLTILIGCVDNTAARKEIAKQAQSYNSQLIWWLDCGNRKTSGQVLLGRKRKDGEQPLTFQGLCTWLPLPSEQHPELVSDETQPTEMDNADDSHLSCAELAMKGSQSLSINFRIAAIASEMLGKMLLTNDLETFAVYVDQATGEMRKYITDKAIRAYLKKLKTSTKQIAPQNADNDLDDDDENE
jgi:PRTRC genetic system ThiF family protein